MSTARIGGPCHKCDIPHPSGTDCEIAALDFDEQSAMLAAKLRVARSTPKPRFDRKPTRRQLIAVIEELQYLVGVARNSYMNDRDPDRFTHTVRPLEEAELLCIESRAFDQIRKRS